MHMPEAQTHASRVSASLSWVLLLLLIAVVVGASLRPTTAVPAAAAVTEFSSARAMQVLNQFAKKPHPVGSAEHERVQQYLSGRMTELGMDTVVETHTGVEVRGHRFTAARVSNLVGRLKGTDNTRAVVLLAHYDSVDRAPGAGDDGGGVAAILETTRALKAGPQLRNDVIVLLTDGEELGLLGARSALEHDPWLRQVGVMFNFEGRGDRGPSEMFETSGGNSALIREFVDAAPHKTGSSLLYTIYKALPNDTDYTVFKNAGLPGMNFAWIGRWEAYHSQLDTPENLDQKGLQQEGSNALALTRRFGNLDLHKMRMTGAGDEVFFNVFGMWMVHYPGWMVAPLVGLLTLGIAVVLINAVGLRRLRVMSLLQAVGVALLLVFAATLACAAMFGVEHLFLSKRMQLGDTPANTWLLVGMLLFGSSLWLAIFRIFRRRMGTASLTAGGCVLVWVLVVLMTLTLPLASYLVFWPLVFATLSLVFQLRAGANYGGNTQVAVAWTGAVPAVLLLAPTIYLFFVALFLNLPLAVVCGLILGIGLLLITPLASHLVPSRAPVLMLLTASIVAVAVAGVLSRPSAQHPQPDTLIYRLDADTGKAEWASLDKAVDPWTSKLLTMSPQRGKLIWPGPTELDGLVADAPTLTLTAPELSVVSSRQDGDVRTVQMHLASPREASWLHLQLGAETELLQVTIDGEEAEDRKAKDSSSQKLPWAFNLYGYPASGVAVTMRLKGAACSATLTDEQYGLPMMVLSRPENRMAWYGSDYTSVTRHVTIC